MSLKITQNYARNFKRFGQKRDGVFDSIEVHSIGCPQNSIAPIRANMDVYSPSGIVHAIIAADVEDTVEEILPEDNVVWADGGYGNHHSFTFEVAESDYMRYTSGANYVVTDQAKFLADVRRGYNTAVKYTAKKCKKFGFDPRKKLSNGLHVVYSHNEGRIAGVSSAHVDPTHLWCKIGKDMDDFRADVAAKMGLAEKVKTVGTQASDFTGSEARKAGEALDLIRACDDSGILWSVTAAQWVLESGYCTTDLAVHANNCFGMKTSLSGNTWASVWDGKSTYTKKTAEQTKAGEEYYVTAAFRKYPCIEDSIRDHSKYLLGAMNGDRRRYENVEYCEGYRNTIELIKRGGYATDVRYVEKICGIIQRFGLDKYDVECIAKRKGSTVYQVKVTEPINIRKKPKASSALVGKCPKGTFTVVAEKKASKNTWGQLLSGAGWIRLDQCERV